jgi:PKD repeat protein
MWLVRISDPTFSRVGLRRLEPHLFAKKKKRQNFHTYSQPGSYEVNIVVTDDSGNIFSKSMYVTVASGFVDEKHIKDKQVIPFISSTSLIVLIVSAVMFCLIIFFRKSIKYFVLSYVIGLSSRIKLSYSNYEIKRLEAKKQKILFRTNNLLMKSDRATVVKQVPSNFVARFYDNLQEDVVKTGQPVNFHLNNSSNKFDRSYTNMTIDNFFYNQKAEVESHAKADSLFEDINDKVDRLLLSVDSKKMKKSHDQGADLLLERPGERVVVQIKKQKIHFCTSP